MRIFVLTIGFLFFSSAATLAAEKVVLSEGEFLICTKRVLTHRNYVGVDDFGFPIIISQTKDDMKKEYQNWLEEKHKMDAVSGYTFTTFQNNKTVLANGFMFGLIIFTKNIDDTYVPEVEHSNNFSSYSAYLAFYKNNNDHYFAHAITPQISWVDMCVLD